MTFHMRITSRELEIWLFGGRTHCYASTSLTHLSGPACTAQVSGSALSLLMLVKSRSLVEDISERIEITYSPLFVGTGVQATKDAQLVVNVVHNAGLARLVARLKLVIVVKG